MKKRLVQLLLVQLVNMAINVKARLDICLLCKNQILNLYIDIGKEKSVTIFIQLMELENSTTTAGEV